MKRPIGIALGLIALAVIVIQLIPYGRDHTNPPVIAEPRWDSPRTRELAVRACFDCHSNETVWPWYTNIAPISWLTQRDVNEGRRELNFSEWNRPPEEPQEVARSVQTGQMPPPYYSFVQGKARLSPTETQELIRGLEATLGTSPSQATQESTGDD